MKKIFFLSALMFLNTSVNATIEIRQFQPSQTEEVRLALGSIWKEFSGWKMSAEEIAEKYCEEELYIQSLYFDNDGTYLTLQENGKIVGTGALKKIDAQTAELKRMYLYSKYHGSGWALKIFDQLMDFARTHGYKKVRLGVYDPVLQARAVAFYKKQGFYPIDRYDDQNLGLYMEKLIYPYPENTKLIGHRGASAYYSENTIESFIKAIELDVWAIELDVRRCKSGELVVMHDATVDRMTTSRGSVAKKSLQDLQALSFKKGGSVPTLSQALDAIAGRAVVILDLKEEGIAWDIVLLIRHYVEKKQWKYEQFYATGFEHRELKKLHELLPAVRLAPAITGTPANLAQSAQDLGASAVCFLDVVFSKSVFDDARKRGLETWIYLFDESEENIKKFKQMAMNAIMLNAPDKVK